MPTIRNRVGEPVKTKRELVKLIMADLKNGKYKGHLLYHGKDPGKRAERLVKRSHMLYGGQGRHNMPGMKHSKLYTKPVQVEPEGEGGGASDERDLVRVVLSLQDHTKTSALAELDEINPEHGLDKDALKAEIIEELALAKIGA